MPPGSLQVDLIQMAVANQLLTSGFDSGREVCSGHGARLRPRQGCGKCSGGSDGEWIDLVDRSIHSACVNKHPCNGCRGVNRGVGMGQWPMHVPRVYVRGSIHDI